MLCTASLEARRDLPPAWMVPGARHPAELIFLGDVVGWAQDLRDALGESVRRDLLRQKGRLVGKFHSFVLLLFLMIELEENPRETILKGFWGGSVTARRKW